MIPDSVPSPQSGNLEDLTHSIEVTATLPGTVIGLYRLVRQLGEGGMGVVYHAHQIDPIRRDVALKVIKPGMDSKQVIARFESERQALAMMDHTNIARVFDAGTTAAGLPYFVMELVDGVPITRYCDSKNLSLRERIELFIPVCQAIQHAHQKGIIHRDIKPSNVLVKEGENQTVAKVIDFGLAKALGQKLSNATMFTTLGAVVGTMQYMSPEQAELGRSDIDTRSDVYSLGALLYELVTGSTPLEYDPTATSGDLEILQRIREEEPKPPSMRLRRSAELKAPASLWQRNSGRLSRSLDHELDWIVMKALEKDRARRYETVNGMARDLQRYLEGEPVEAAPPSAAYRIGKFVRKHRAWMAIAAAFTALLAGGVVLSSWMAVRATRAEQVTKAVSDFLQTDVLGQASANIQASQGNKPDPDLKVRTALDRAAAGIAGKFGTQPLVEASIRQTIGRTYEDLGLFSEAQQHLERALELRRSKLGDEHPDTLTSMDQLGLLYQEAGNYALSESLLTKALDIERRVLGEANSETSTTMNNLALTVNREGKYAEAETLYTNALAITRRVNGEQHPETLTTMNNLGMVYFRQAKYGQAEPIFTTTLAIGRRVWGKEHPSTYTVMNNLGLVYVSEGKYAEAEPLRTAVVEYSRRVLGEEHPNTLTATANLAMLYRLEGKHAQAEALFVKALATGRRVQGLEHPNTLLTMYKLAELYQDQRMYAQAEAFFVEVLDARRRVLGEQHPDTLNTLTSVGRARLRQQKYGGAEVALRDALRGYENAKSGTWERYGCESMLGATLAGQNKYAEAEPLLLAGYEGMHQRKATIQNESRPALEEAGDRIVQLYEAWKQPQKATEWKQKLGEIKIGGGY